MSKQPIVEILWRDAFGGSSWGDVEDHAEEFLVHTIGYLLWEDKNYIGTGASIVPEHGSTANTTHIPKGCIISIKYLRGKNVKHSKTKP